MAESYVEEVVPNLYNSQFCRLCGDENSNGYPLYSAENDEEDFSTIINMFLPIRISDDGKYPRWICPGCHLQVEGTAEFFNRVLIGQDKLRQILNNENEIVVKSELNEIEPNTTLNKQENENYADRINNTSLLPETIEKDEHFFPDEHTLVRSITPIKRKRGRPKKEKKLEIINKEIIEKIVEIKTEFDPLISENPKDEQYDDSSGRRKRQIKVPQRYEGTVQGKELEKVYADLGVAERGSYKNSVNDCVFVQYKDENGDIREELIGHVQDDSGVNLGDLFLINLKVDDKFYKDNLNTKKTQFVCDICKVCFWKETKFLQHRLSHKNVRFECTRCLRNFKERSELIEHQDKEDHQGEGIIEGFESIIDENFSQNDDEVLPIVETRKPQEDVNTLLEQIESTNLDLINNELNDDINKTSSKQLNFINEQNVNNNEINETNVNTFIEQPEQNLILSLIQPTEQQPQNENIENIQTENLMKIAINNNETSTTKTGKYICDQCNKVFSRLNPFITHKRIDHGTNRQFVCSKCDKRFKSKTLLQRHHIAHSDNRPFKCETCGAEFKTKNSLTAHETCHTGNKKYVCETCNHSFVHKHSLKLHLDIHLGTKPHKCPVCNKGFSQLGNMQEHHRIHTGERPFDCKICGKSFKTSSQCRMHVTRHEVHRPMKCNMCHKSFINNEELKVHIRRHTNEKPYSCKVCSKNFIDIPSIKKHMRLHTGEKPYSCTKCARRFADRSNLTKHKKLHESKELMANLIKIEQDLDENTQEVLPPDITTNPIPMSQSLILSDITQNPATSTVWSIIDDNNSVPADPPPSNSIELPLSTIESKQDNVASNQIVYVTYQDPNNPVDNKTTLYVVQ